MRSQDAIIATLNSIVDEGDVMISLRNRVSVAEPLFIISWFSTKFPYPADRWIYACNFGNNDELHSNRFCWQIYDTYFSFKNMTF